MMRGSSLEVLHTGNPHPPYLLLMSFLLRGSCIVNMNQQVIEKHTGR